MPWWRHQLETLSALLALCEENPPITGGFPSQRPVTRSFDIFFDMRLNKWLSKQSRWWWFETPWRSLWRHCNAENCQSHRTVTIPLASYSVPYSLWYITAYVIWHHCERLSVSNHRQLCWISFITKWLKITHLKILLFPFSPFYFKVIQRVIELQRKCNPRSMRYTLPSTQLGRVMHVLVNIHWLR